MRNSIVSSAIILTIAGVITRILGFVYRIFMSNLIGAEGMGLYQLILPVYSLAWSIACSGFTTTISKLVAQEKAKGEEGNMGLLLKQCVMITTVLGFLLFVLLYFFADELAILFFRDARIALSLRILSLALPFMAAGSCVRGYFFGLQEPIIPATNQVFEQCFRMLVVFFLAGFFIPLGIEYAAVVAVIGLVAEEIFSFVYIFFAYKIFKKKRMFKKRPSLTSRQSYWLICTMALPLTANRVTGSLLATIENALIPQRLQLYGLSASEAMSLFGQISGMAMPLIYFPSAFLISLSISLVPAVSEASAINNRARITTTTSKSILFSAIIGFMAAAIFITFSFELGDVIYNQDISRILVLLGIMCPLLYMQVVLSGILNGLGFQMFIFKNSLISSFISIVCIYFLVPIRGADGFVLGWFLSLMAVCFLSMVKLKQSVSLHFDFANFFMKPLLSALAAGLFTRYLANSYLFPKFGEILGLVIGISLLCGIYMMWIIATQCLNLEDIRTLLKFGRKKGDLIA